MFLKNAGRVRALVRTIFLLINSGTFSNLIVTNLRLSGFKNTVILAIIYLFEVMVRLALDLHCL